MARRTTEEKAEVLLLACGIAFMVVCALLALPGITETAACVQQIEETSK